jgi:subtilisin-like proprotein convertase family protein
LIPDANPVGITTIASVSGVAGYVQNVVVNLNITGGFNGDLCAYLVDPLGHLSVLLNRPGMGSANPFGNSDAGFNITLDDSVGANNIHNYQNYSPSFSSGQLTGTWAADGINISPLSTPGAFDTAPSVAGLSLFYGDLPSGNWTLFIADLSGGGQSTLVSWGLQIVTVPEPQSWVLVAAGFAMLALLSYRRRACNSSQK